MVSSISPILWASFDIVIIVITVIDIVSSIMLATISDVWVQGAKLQRPRHHPRQLQYMQLPSNILIWVIIIVIMIIILCNIANFEGVKTQNWLHGGSLLYQPMPCRGGGPSGGMRHWFHASIEPSSFDDSSPWSSSSLPSSPLPSSSTFSGTRWGGGWFIQLATSKLFKLLGKVRQDNDHHTKI